MRNKIIERWRVVARSVIAAPVLCADMSISICSPAGHRVCPNDGCLRLVHILRSP